MFEFISLNTIFGSVYDLTRQPTTYLTSKLYYGYNLPRNCAEVEIRRHPSLFIIKRRESFDGIIQFKRIA
ncbi:hypothetical protein Hanom_Chr01g00030641 [Helianthus anomalus]